MLRVTEAADLTSLCSPVVFVGPCSVKSVMPEVMEAPVQAVLRVEISQFYLQGKQALEGTSLTSLVGVRSGFDVEMAERPISAGIMQKSSALSAIDTFADPTVANGTR